MTREFQATKVKKKSRIKKILKWSGIVFLLLLITLISLPFIFKDKLVEVFKTEMNNSVNAKVDFGDFDLTLFSSFPYFSFDIQDVTVTGVNEFEGVSLAKIKKTSIKLDLMSVISGDKIKVKSIVIDEPTLNIIVTKDSLTNYDIVKSYESDTIQTDEADEPLQYEIELNKLKINKANVIYKDALSNISSEVKNMDFDLSGDFTQDVFDIKTVTAIEELSVSEGMVGYLNKTKVSFDADINIDKFTKYTLKENTLKLNQLDLGFDGWVELLEDKINIEMKFNSKRTDFKSILSLIPALYSRDFKTIDTKGNIVLYGDVKGSLEGDSYPSFNLDMGITEGYFKYPEMPNSADNINIKTKITHPQGGLDKMKIDVSKLHLELANNPIDATLKLSNPISDPNIESVIKATIDLEKLQTVIPMKENEKLNGKILADLDLVGKVSSITNKQYQDFKAVGILSVKNMLYSSKGLPYDVVVNSMTMDFSTQFLDLKELDTKIGKSDIQVVGRIDNILPYIFSNEVLKGAMKITSNTLNIDDLMRTVPSEAESKTGNTPVDSNDKAFKVPALYDINLTTDIKELIYEGLSIKNVKGKVGVKDEIANLSNVSMDMLDGNIIVDGSYNSKNKNPLVDFNYKIKNVDIKKTAHFFSSIETIAPVAKYCKGKISTNLKVSSELDQKMSPIYSSINGVGGLFSDNLTVTGIKALQEIAEVLKIDKLANQNLKKLKMVFQFKEGRAFVNPFDINLSGIPTEVNGSTGFDQTIAYNLKMKVPKEKLGNKANETIGGLLGKVKGFDLKLPAIIPINFIVSGTVSNPILKSNLGDQANNVVTDFKDKVVDTIKKTFNKEIEKIMIEANLQAQKLKGEAKIQADKLRAEGIKLTEQAKAKADNIANQAKVRADEEAEKLIRKRGNPFEKIANKKLAEVLKTKAYEQIDKTKLAAYKKAEIPANEAEEKAKSIENEADEQSKKMLDMAKQRADKLKQ